VREDDDDPEVLDDDVMELTDGEVVAMAVNEPLVWQACAGGAVTLSEDGALATPSKDSQQHQGCNSLLATSGLELTAGRHYWVAELEGSTEYHDTFNTCIGVIKAGAAQGDHVLQYGNSEQGFLQAHHGGPTEAQPCWLV
jgi:hypothetical protein